MAGLNPAAGALSDTRVDGSAHRNSPKPTQMARALDVLITDKPPVLGTRTLEEEKDARLAHLEQKRYDAAARNRAHQLHTNAKDISQAKERKLLPRR